MANHSNCIFHLIGKDGLDAIASKFTEDLRATLTEDGHVYDWCDCVRVTDGYYKVHFRTQEHVPFEMGVPQTRAGLVILLTWCTEGMRYQDCNVRLEIDRESFEEESDSKYLMRSHSAGSCDPQQFSNNVMQFVDVLLGRAHVQGGDST